jgi:hypothetical protein
VVACSSSRFASSFPTTNLDVVVQKLYKDACSCDSRSNTPCNLIMSANGTSTLPSPLTKSGALDAKFKFEETTPVVGREYPEANIVDEILRAPDADELIRDLAITSKSFTKLHLKFSMAHLI